MAEAKILDGLTNEQAVDCYIRMQIANLALNDENIGNEAISQALDAYEECGAFIANAITKLELAQALEAALTADLIDNDIISQADGVNVTEKKLRALAKKYNLDLF